MASKKKAPEGIALLSMYNDEDDEMDAAADDDEAEDVEFNIASTREDDFYQTDFSASADWVHENTPQVAEEVSTPKSIRLEVPLTPQQSQPPQLSPPTLKLQPERPKSGKEKLAIVDYGHDEVALSPDAEEREVTGFKLVVANGELQNVNGHSYERILESIEDMPLGITQTEQLDLSHNAAIEQEDMVVDIDAQTSVAPSKDVSLDKFLPPPVEAKCSYELQEKINKFLSYKKHGKSFNAEVRNRKDYRNPDFLLHAVRYQDIDQIGSCFSKDVFDPHGYDKGDYYDEIEAGVARQLEKREQQRKKSPKVDFVSGGSQPGSATKTTMLVQRGLPNASTSGSLPNPSPSESRHNKKSKWDKVDGERSNPIGGQESASTAGAHMAILSAANAGAGYTAFAQQRRREAEEKSGKRRSEKRS